MSKTKTTMFSPNLQAQLINTQNKNNVYDISTGNFICNNSNSLPNNKGRLDSYQKETLDATWVKLLDNNKIILKDNIISDNNGNTINVTNARTAVDTVFSNNNIVDAFNEYYITTTGVYRNNELLFSTNLNSKCYIYIVNKEYIFIFNSEDKTLVHYGQDGTVIKDWSSYLNSYSQVFVDENAEHIFIINNSEHILLNTTTEEPVITTIDSNVDIFKGGVTVNAKLSFTYKMNSDHTCKLTYNNITTSLPIIVNDTTDVVQCLYSIKLKYDGTLECTWYTTTLTAHEIWEDIASVSDGTLVSVIVKDIRLNTYKGCILGYAYLSSAMQTQEEGALLLTFIAMLNGKECPIFNVRNSSGTKYDNTFSAGFPVTKNNENAYYYNRNVYYINNIPLYVVDNNVVIPYGFIDKIYSNNNNNITYLSSIDNKIHYVSVKEATEEDLYDIETLEINSFSSPFNKGNTNFSQQNNFSYAYNRNYTYTDKPTAQALLMSWATYMPSTAVYYTGVVGNNIIWQPNKCTTVLNMTFGLPKNFNNLIINWLSNFYSEVFFGTDTLLYCKYQDETSLDLSDISISSDIANRVGIPLGSKIVKLTPDNYICLFGDTWFKPYTYAGSIIPAIDLTSTSLASSTDVITNVISLRGNLFTLKNNSIYEVTNNDGLSIGKYLSSFGRMKYLCSNDNYMFFKDEILHRILSFDASYSWNVFLDTPEFDIEKGFISSQNECVLYNNNSILIINSSQMSKFNIDTTTNFSSNGAELAIQNVIYKPVEDKGEMLEFSTSWLGSTQCRQLLQLDTIYFEVESYDDNINFSIELEMLVDSVVKAGKFKIVKTKLSDSLYYFRIQPNTQRCNAFRYTVKCNGAIKRICYSITQDEEIIPMVEPTVIKEVKL